MNTHMHIVEVAAEFAPIAKAGGLGEVLVGLTRELIRVGEKVEIILPKYGFISPQKMPRLKQATPEFFVLERGRSITNTMWETKVEDCPLRLLETKHPDNYFHRDKIYGFQDDVARFLYFSRAVVEYLKIKQEPIDILHIHDWHVSAMAPLIREIYHQEIKVRSIVLSIHNIEYQGQCTNQDLEAIGLKKEHNKRFSSNNNTHSHQFNLLKAGIEYSDAIIPVSITYAQEILTPTHGFGLDAVLCQNKTKIHGILNGIDLHLWDPATDIFLPAHYSVSDSFNTITAAKKRSRKLFVDRFHLDESKRPWIGAITRLVPQKGLELFEEAIHQTISLKGTFALIGSSPIPQIQRHFETLKERYKNNPQAFFYLDYDEGLAHQLYASLDFLLVPSHFEPCGLTQMIAMHYGTIPIARSTGGLKDTVFDPQYPSTASQKQNGFIIPEGTLESLHHTLHRAFRIWQSEPLKVQMLIRHGMESDFGWKRPAQEYLKVFKKLMLYRT